MEQPKVYISYTWKPESKSVVDQIELALLKAGIELARDRNEVKYRDRIDHFMDKIGNGDLIILVIGKEYLESKYCMYELLQIYDNKDNFEDRIFPILLSNANIDDPEYQIRYPQFWKEKYESLDKIIREGELANAPHEWLVRYRDFSQKIGALTYFLSQINAQSLDYHQYTNFKDLVDAIKERLKDLGGGNNTSPPPSHSTTTNSTQPHTSSTTSPVALKSEIKQLITRGNMDKAFDRLQQVISNDSRHANVLLGLQSQYSSLSRDNRIGILSNSEYSVQNNRITYNLLSVVDDLEDEDLK